ncbi:MAG: DUF4012 domain-containing protein [Methanobrevibacter sp.]|nr:DUF4012 domain-containing protein [Methanobrevibacter sp.]
MDRKKKIIIAILIVLMIGIITILFGAFFTNTGGDLSSGNGNILVCAVDESESRAGLGAVDMAFIVTIENGKIKDYKAVYPGGMTHPNASEPAEAQAQGAGPKLLLHDSFWYSDNEKCMQLAKEIVEYQLQIPIDGVVAINSKGLDKILDAASPLKINGTTVNASGIDIIREEQSSGGESRGDAVLDIVRAAAESATNPDKKAAMVNVALSEYSKGNIIMTPQGSFVGLLATEGIENILH